MLCYYLKENSGAKGLITHAISLTTVGTLIKKAFWWPHQAEVEHMATGLGKLLKFQEFLGSTMYMQHLN
jgi:hypothetical protein